MVDVDLLYRQQLTEADRGVLTAAAGSGTSLEHALTSPAVESVVFGPGDNVGVVRGVSPFLAFAVAVHQTARALESASFVEERWAPRVRVPVFDVAELRGLLADPVRRYFLIELLASYTRVASGVTWTRTARGWRRRRFSEMDPGRLAAMLEVVPDEERPGVYRRLGDLALFLLGVFPDHPALPAAGASTERMLRLSGVGVDRAGQLGGHELLELLGARWYTAAVASASAAGRPVTGTLAVAGYMGEHFHAARRVLNAVTDRYLFPWRQQWFTGG
jgi:hypothetical protein